jgi:hypothetical protein
MDRYRSSRSVAVSAAVAVAIISVLAIVASGVLGASGPPGGRPSPSDPPGTPGAPSPSLPAPSFQIDDASDGIDLVGLINWPGVDSSAIVWDETDSLADAVTGQPDRAPVGYEDLEVRQLGVDAIRLTWSDLPIGNQVRVTVRYTDDGRVSVRLYRPLPESPSDGVVSNRVLDLRFHVVVEADGVDAELVQGMTPTDAVGFVERELKTSDGGGLSIAVWDDTEGLSGAEIVSVDGAADLEPEILGLENLGDGVIRARWSDPEGFTPARLSIRMLDDGRYQFRLVRVRPVGPTLPPAVERVVDLQFGVHIVAADVDVEVLDVLANGG